MLTIVIMLPVLLNAQVSSPVVSHQFRLNTEFMQIKDEFNYGLNFNGLNLDFGYTYQRVVNGKTFTYSPEFGFGANYKKGIGLMLSLRPVDMSYAWVISGHEGGSFSLGAYLVTDYHWQLYPELQSGHMFWFSSIEIGPHASWQTEWRDHQLLFTLSNSIAGFNSRPEPATETYYYSLRFSDFIKNALSNMQFGSFDLFNHTRLAIQFWPGSGRKLSYSYVFEYYGYYQEPGLDFITHGIGLNWKIGKK
jgi:hypothetical protein